MKKNLLLVSLVVILAIVPLIFLKGTEFGGADGEAEKMINEIQPEYKTWFDSIWEPPGGETESLLFSLQAAIGAGFIGYFIGTVRQKNKQKASIKSEKKSNAAH